MGLEFPKDEDLRQIMKLQVETSQILDLINELIALGTWRFQFSGQGELFLHRNAIEILGHAKYNGCTCLVNTAGHLLDRDKIDALLKMRFDELRITTMAGTREMYLRTHPGVKDTTFSRIEENLCYLAERKNAFGLNRPEVSLCYIVIKQNYDGLVDFAKFANLVSANRVVYRPFDDVEDPGLAKLVLSPKEATVVKKQLIEVKIYLESKGIKHNIDNFLKVFKEKLNTTSLYRVIPCYYGWLAVRIAVDGNVYPCCRCYSSFGNAYEKQFSEIWNGHPYREFRREAIKLNKRQIPVSNCVCNSCVHHTANLRVYQVLYFLRKRSIRLKGLYPVVSGEEKDDIG